jgi:predicted nucleic acid-binding protein
MMMVVDAGVILSAYFPDEETHGKAQELVGDYTADLIDLTAPRFARYEIISACHVAARRGRISLSRAAEIAEAINELIRYTDDLASPWEIISLSDQIGISTYDALYLALAMKLDAPLITADRRLFEKANAQKANILWIGDYPPLKQSPS